MKTIIDEAIVKEANSACCAMGDINNSFSKVLKTGEFYKNNGMTPIYVLDEENMVIHVDIEERAGKKLQ